MQNCKEVNGPFDFYLDKFRACLAQPIKYEKESQYVLVLLGVAHLERVLRLRLFGIGRPAFKRFFHSISKIFVTMITGNSNLGC